MMCMSTGHKILFAKFSLENIFMRKIELDVFNVCERMRQTEITISREVQTDWWIQKQGKCISGVNPVLGAVNGLGFNLSHLEGYVRKCRQCHRFLLLHRTTPKDFGLNRPRPRIEGRKV